MNYKLLPIGSVVMLKNSTAALLVAGYVPVTQSRPDYVWDYSGFKFPIGYMHNSEVYCFNHDQIEEVLCYGYQDAEGAAFVRRVEASIDEVRELVGKQESDEDEENEEGGNEDDE